METTLTLRYSWVRIDNRYFGGSMQPNSFLILSIVFSLTRYSWFWKTSVLLNPLNYWERFLLGFEHFFEFGQQLPDGIVYVELDRCCQTVAWWVPGRLETKGGITIKGVACRLSFSLKLMLSYLKFNISLLIMPFLVQVHLRLFAHNKTGFIIGPVFKYNTLLL